MTLHGLQQHYIKLDENGKNRKLNELLDALEFNQVGCDSCFEHSVVDEFQKVVIFVKSVTRANELDKLLRDYNFPSICIHSGLAQEERYVLPKHALVNVSMCLISESSDIRRSKPLRNESWWLLTSLVAALMWRELTLLSIMMPLVTLTVIFIVSGACGCVKDPFIN